ncbi:unnamed protein product [Macrosiphum euphorbiae]|uniref:DUF5641 domain-containing protein n=1 Tax=Macrosiphum euphorbiae TaxID=13131 RepID=A0AAV0Y448_9HEMI|nr:unnamed protein product [Macrosiphum euphorbiae]
MYSDNALNTFCLPREIDWHFIPPASPHFGGIWEANIKSFEAQLNSRPLCPASMEATDYSALTPGHFLLGKAPMSLPEVDIPEPTPTNRLTSNGINGPLPSLTSKSTISFSSRKKIWLEVHPNPADHFVRVVTLKTKDSVLKRPINKLIRLPIEH